MRLFFWAAILGGVGYAGLRVPVGGGTSLDHLRAVSWRGLADQARSLAGASPSVRTAEPETITAADRRALEDLLPR